jgi:hypothetical protein
VFPFLVEDSESLGVTQTLFSSKIYLPAKNVRIL